MSLVVGYVPGVDRWPRLPRRHRLASRFAFVLHTYRPDRVDMYFDRDLHEAILAALWRITDARRADACDDAAETRCDTLATLLEVARLRDEPLLRIVFYDAEGAIALIVESEPWAYAGGPTPYHDSFTLAVFSRSDLSSHFSGAARETTHLYGATVLDTVIAEPQPPSIVRHLAAFIRRRLHRS